MEKLTENIMKKNFFNFYKKFIKKNLTNYDIIYVTSDLRGFLLKYDPIRANELCEVIINCLLKENKTIIIPAYSYTNHGKFFVDKTLTNLGYLSKWCFKKKFKRSDHPIFSIYVIGKLSKKFTRNGKSAYGKKSFWQKMLKEKSSLFHIGRPFSLGNTIIHFVEKKMKAQYRYNKVFNTKVFDRKKYLGTNFSAYVQKKNYKKKIETDTIKISKKIEKKNFYKKIGNDKNFTNLTHVDFYKAYNFMCNEFKKNNRIFIK